MLGEQGAEATPSEITAFFDEFDRDGSGTISIAEFSKNLRSMGRRGSTFAKPATLPYKRA